MLPFFGFQDLMKRSNIIRNIQRDFVDEKFIVRRSIGEWYYQKTREENFVSEYSYNILEK